MFYGFNSRMSYAKSQAKLMLYITKGLACQQIENMAYPVTAEALYTVFSPYGYVQKIAAFEKNGQWQALIQFPDNTAAGNAKAALEGHAIYDGGYNRVDTIWLTLKTWAHLGCQDK